MLLVNSCFILNPVFCKDPSPHSLSFLICQICVPELDFYRADSHLLKYIQTETLTRRVLSFVGYLLSIAQSSHTSCGPSLLWESCPLGLSLPYQ